MSDIKCSDCGEKIDIKFDAGTGSSFALCCSVAATGATASEVLGKLRSRVERDEKARKVVEYCDKCGQKVI